MRGLSKKHSFEIALALILPHFIAVSQELNSNPMHYWATEAGAPSGNAATFPILDARRYHPVEIISNMDAKDIEIGDVKVKIRTSNWVDDLCSANQNRGARPPDGLEHYPIAIVKVGSADSAGFSVALSNLAKCEAMATWLVKPMIFPLGMMGPVFLTRSAEVLPNWLTLDDIAAASLIKMSSGRSFKDPLVAAPRECIPLANQPGVTPISSSHGQISPDCVFRTDSGTAIYGVWSSGQRYFNRTAHAAVAFESTRVTRYEGDSRPNSLINWANIDNGIKPTPIRFLLIRRSSDASTAHDLSLELCKSTSDFTAPSGVF